MLVAAVCHDIDHTGMSNAFEIASMSELALRYNDRSVLESHHAAVTFRVMLNHDTGLMRFFTLKEMRQVRSFIVGCILATDMATHHQVGLSARGIAVGERMVYFSRAYICCFQNHEFAQRLGETPDIVPTAASAVDERVRLMGLIIHSCDLGNGVVPSFTMCRRWAQLVMQEFTNQVQTISFIL
jgi:cAMP-specific phosphodiesterase 4